MLVGQQGWPSSGRQHAGAGMLPDRFMYLGAGMLPDRFMYLIGLERRTEHILKAVPAFICT